MTSANLTGLHTDGRNTVAATVTNFKGQSAKVVAKNFILAMGGIENSRMLLWFNHQANGQLIDPRAPLGRYWMEHPAYEVGYALVDFKISKGDYFRPQLLLRFTEEVYKKLGILECSFVLEGIESSGTMGLVKDLICVAPRVGEWAASLAGKNLVCGAKFIIGFEQEPVWSNHVKLSETKRDRFGIPMVELHWKKTHRDRATMQKALTHFNEFLMAKQHGRLKLADWVLAKEGYPRKDIRELVGIIWAVHEWRTRLRRVWSIRTAGCLGKGICILPDHRSSQAVARPTQHSPSYSSH